MTCRVVLAVGILAAASSGVAAQPQTFNDDVAPILYRHCVTCHRPGDIGPVFAADL